LTAKQAAVLTYLFEAVDLGEATVLVNLEVYERQGGNLDVGEVVRLPDENEAGCEG
jgi:hypothetical protein